MAAARRPAFGAVAPRARFVAPMGCNDAAPRESIEPPTWEQTMTHVSAARRLYPPAAARGLVVLAALLAAPTAVLAEGRATDAAIRWLSDDGPGFARAREAGLPVVVDFWADWCGACAVLERVTFSDPRVVKALERFVAIRLDGSEGSAALASGRFDGAAERWQVRGLPTVLLLDPRGRVLDRIEGVVDAGEFLERLRSAESRCRSTLACRRGAP